MHEARTKSQIIKYVVLSTLVFVFVVLGIWAWGNSPTTPNFAPGDYYEVETWATTEIQQRAELQDGPISIDEAKAMLVEQGLPTIDSVELVDGTVEGEAEEAMPELEATPESEQTP